MEEISKAICLFNFLPIHDGTIVLVIMVLLSVKPDCSNNAFMNNL